MNFLFFFWRPAIYVTSLCYCFMLLANKLMKINCPVCNVGVLWPNGWTDHDLGMQVGLGPGHIVLDGDPRISWPNGWMDQDATWYGDRPQPRPHCVRWGPSWPLPERGRAASSQFLAHDCCGQTVAHLSNCCPAGSCTHGQC